MNVATPLTLVDTALAVPDAVSGEIDGATEYLPQARMEFHVTDLDGVNWVCGKVRACEERLADLEEWYRAQKAALQHEKAFFENRFGPEVRAVVEAEVVARQAAKPSAPKSVSLPNGKPGFRTVPAGIVVTDVKKAVEWAMQNCVEAVTLTPSLRTTPLQELFSKTGEVPEGTEYKAESQTFSLGVPDITKKRAQARKAAEKAMDGGSTPLALGEGDSE